MKFGETGRNLEIDLTRESFSAVESSGDLFTAHLGGRCTAAGMIRDRVPSDADPASGKNLLIFSSGLLNGSLIPGANCTTVSTISPQTNHYVTSSFDGFFGTELKYAGFDKLVIKGKASGWVYLFIKNGKAELRDASHLLGKSALQTASLIQRELKDPKIQVAAIGLAGEYGVYQAAIGHSGTAAGRGPGAVMGGKLLKAIAVRGTLDVYAARPNEHFRLFTDYFGAINDNPHCGDPFHVSEDAPFLEGDEALNGVKGLWTPEQEEEWGVTVEREYVFLQWENYSQEMEEVVETVIEKSERIRGTGCANCPKYCHKLIMLPGKRKYFLKSYLRLAYLTALVKNLKINYEVLYALQEYGLDEAPTLHLCSQVAALYEAGVLGDEALPGFPKDPLERILYLIEKLALRQGIGELLAKGEAALLEAFGEKSKALGNLVKKVAYPSTITPACGLQSFLMYATGGKMDITQIEGSFPKRPLAEAAEREAFAARWAGAPARFKAHFLSWLPGEELSPEAAAEVVEWNQLMHSLDEKLGLCPLLSSARGQYGGTPPYHLYNIPELVAAVAGIEITPDEFFEAARQNLLIEREINVSRGLSRSDELPEGTLWKAWPRETAELYLDEYYRLKGWTKDGAPTAEALEKYGLDATSGL